MDEIIYFDLNNWSAGNTYPNAEPFISWMGGDLNTRLYDDVWVKRNNLVVVAVTVDQSISFNVSAPKKWVMKNCPSLLDEYSKFICIADKENELPDPHIYGSFMKYCEENIGLHYDDTWFE